MLLGEFPPLPAWKRNRAGRLVFEEFSSKSSAPVRESKFTVSEKVSSISEQLASH